MLFFSFPVRLAPYTEEDFLIFSHAVQDVGEKEWVNGREK